MHLSIPFMKKRASNLRDENNWGTQQLFSVKYLFGEAKIA